MNRSKKHRNTNSNTRKIFYTGMNAKKSGKHTIKEFMEKDKKGCSKYIAGKSCIPCAKFNNLAKKVSKRYKTITKKNRKKCDKYLEACEKCKTQSKIRCTLHEYLEYSGAELQK